MNFFKRLFQAKVEQVKDWQDPDREASPMPCPEITLEGIPQDLYDKLLIEAKAAGGVFVGTSVLLDHCWFDWNYDAPTQTLHITATKKPFFIDCETIEQKIRELVNGAKDVVG